MVTWSYTLCCSSFLSNIFMIKQRVEINWSLGEEYNMELSVSKIHLGAFNRWKALLYLMTIFLLSYYYILVIFVGLYSLIHLQNPSVTLENSVKKFWSKNCIIVTPYFFFHMIHMVLTFIYHLYITESCQYLHYC